MLDDGLPLHAGAPVFVYPVAEAAAGAVAEGKFTAEALAVHVLVIRQAQRGFESDDWS
jgi:hypothetical protein